jgi:hypothetical protein
VLVDKNPDEIERAVAEMYNPAVHGGITVLPLRARVEASPGVFADAEAAVMRAVARVRADYSVQAWFGKKWRTNIMRNVRMLAGMPAAEFPARKHVVIAGAGPGLRPPNGAYLIAADTALPCLLAHNIVPDAVLTIDCQNLSLEHVRAAQRLHSHYNHKKPLVFMDLASPPAIAEFMGDAVRFMAGGHPLTRYIAAWLAAECGESVLPLLDTGGGNVCYAALSLAEYFSPEQIDVYGADFSYPEGRTYSRHTYLETLFTLRQNRLNPQEHQSAKLLYRDPRMEKVHNGASWYYDTEGFRAYRRSFIEKMNCMAARVTVHSSGGPEILQAAQGARHPALRHPAAQDWRGVTAEEVERFLEYYTAECAKTMPDEDVLKTTLPYLAWQKTHNSNAN